MADSTFNRRQFVSGVLGTVVGAGLISACGSPDSGGTPSGTSAAPTQTHPPASAEPGKMSIFEWSGYEAAGTKAQTAGMTVAGKSYIDKYGPDSVTYTYIENDDSALQKATSSNDFDLMHPCLENLQDYVNRDLVQPWDTTLLKSFSQLNPYLVQKGQMNGAQYFIPWDWGYGSLSYRTDKVNPADATGWELAWNPKYTGRVALWGGASTNFEIAALKLGLDHIDNLTDDELQKAKAELIAQKPINKFYWDSEYNQMQPALKSGTAWVAYSWQDTLVTLKGGGTPIQFLDPSQGRLSWVCGFMLGKNTQNYYHAHDYVESFINHDACAQMTNAYAYGTSNTLVKPSEIKDQALVASLKLDNPEAIAQSHLQSWDQNHAKLLLAWQQVKAS